MAQTSWVDSYNKGLDLAKEELLEFEGEVVELLPC